MKKLLLLPILFFSIICYSQNVEMAKDAFPTYQGIIKLENKKNKEIYSIIKTWVATSYNSAKDVIQLDDPENGKLIIKAIHTFSNKQTSMLVTANVEGQIDYNLTIDVKDGKFRFTIDITNVTQGTLRSPMMDYMMKKPDSKYSKQLYEEVGKLKSGLINQLSNLKEKATDNW